MKTIVWFLENLAIRCNGREAGAVSLPRSRLAANAGRKWQNGYRRLAAVAGVCRLQRPAFADLVPDQRLGVYAPADRLAGGGDLLPEVWLAAGPGRAVETEPIVCGFFRELDQGA